MFSIFLAGKGSGKLSSMKYITKTIILFLLYSMQSFSLPQAYTDMQIIHSI